MLKKKIEIVWIVLLACFLFNSCTFFTPPNKVNNLAWMCGTWEGTRNGLPYFQEWNLVDDSVLIGLNYTICNGEKNLNDSSSIQLADEKLVYSSGNAIWELEYSSENACKFSNAEFKEAIYFNRKNEVLTIKIDFPTQEINYALKLVASTNKINASQKKYISGQYDGYIIFNQEKQFLTLDFDILNGIQQATISSPSYFLFKKNFTSICYNDPTLLLNFQNLNQVIQLDLKFEDSTLIGKVKYKNSAPVYLTKRNVINRADEIEIQHQNLNSSKSPLEVTFFKPKKAAIQSAVLLISNNTNDNYYGIAKEFAKNKIAVAIYENAANSADSNSDLKAVIDYIKSKTKSDIKIGMMDISSVFNEGLTDAANNKELAFYVSISNQFISNKEKIIEDAKSNLLKNNINKSFFNAASDAWNALFEYAAKRTNQELIVNMLRQADSEGWGKYCLPAKIPSEEELDNSQFWKTINDDPSNALQALSIPTLVIYGEHDKYLNVKLNAERIDQNFKSKPKLLSIRIYGNTDHYLKSSNHPEHLWPTYDEDFIQQTMQWISRMSN